MAFDIGVAASIRSHDGLYSDLSRTVEVALRMNKYVPVRIDSEQYDDAPSPRGARFCESWLRETSLSESQTVYIGLMIDASKVNLRHKPSSQR